MREICPQYDEKPYDLTSVIFSELPHIIDVNARAILTEVVIMSLSGYGEEYYLNDKRFLDERGLAKLANEAVKNVGNRYGSLWIDSAVLGVWG